MSKHPPTREEVAKATAEYLLRGGRITQLPDTTAMQRADLYAELGDDPHVAKHWLIIPAAS